MITYRILPMTEWVKLKDIMPEGKPIPSPEVASAAVAEKRGEIVGVLFLQLAVHMEPLVSKNGDVDYKQLVALLNDALAESCGDAGKCDYYVFSDRAAISRMCERVGMEPTSFAVYRKTVGGE